MKNIRKHNGINDYLLVGTIVAVIIIASVALSYKWWLGPFNDPLKNAEKIQALTGILYLLIGSIASIGSSIVAIKLAQRSLDFSQRLQDKEAIEFAHNNIDEAIKIYIAMINSINDLLYTVSVLEREYEYYISKAIGGDYNSFEGYLSKDSEFSFAEINDEISKLKQSLRALESNEFAYYCFNKKYNLLKESGNLMLNFLKEKINAPTYPADLHDPYYPVTILDIIQWLHRYRHDLKHSYSDHCEIIHKLRTKIIKTNGEDNISSTFMTFLYINAVLHYDKDYIERYGKESFSLSGIALIHDLLYCLPDGDTIFDCFNEKFKESIQGNKRYELTNNFDPLKLISHNFFDQIEKCNKNHNMVHFIL